jgi:hypothetical protein
LNLTCSEVLVSFSLKQGRDTGRETAHPALGVVCPGCGARIGKPCVSTVPTFGAGVIGTPIEGVHAERIAEARARSVA